MKKLLVIFLLCLIAGTAAAEISLPIKVIYPQRIGDISDKTMLVPYRINDSRVTCSPKGKDWTINLRYDESGNFADGYFAVSKDVNCFIEFTSEIISSASTKITVVQTQENETTVYEYGLDKSVQSAYTYRDNVRYDLQKDEWNVECPDIVFRNESLILVDSTISSGFSDIFINELNKWIDGPLYVPKGMFNGLSTEIVIEMDDNSTIQSASIDLIEGDTEDLFSIENYGMFTLRINNVLKKPGTATYKITAVSGTHTAEKEFTISAYEMPDFKPAELLQKELHVKMGEPVDLGSAISNPDGYEEEYYIKFNGSNTSSHTRTDDEPFDIWNNQFTGYKAGRYNVYATISPAINISQSPTEYNPFFATFEFYVVVEDETPSAEDKISYIEIPDSGLAIPTELGESLKLQKIIKGEESYIFKFAENLSATFQVTDIAFSDELKKLMYQYRDEMIFNTEASGVEYEGIISDMTPDPRDPQTDMMCVFVIPKDSRQTVSIMIYGNHEMQEYVTKIMDALIPVNQVDAKPISSVMDIEGNSGTCTANQVNVRREPSMNAGSIGQINIGDSVTILENDGEWSRISCKHGEGWIKTKYIKQ